MSQSIARRIDPLAKALWLVSVSVTNGVLGDPEQLLGSTAIICFSFVLCDRAELAKARTFAWAVAFIPSLLLFYHMALLPIAIQNGMGTTSVRWSASVYSLKILNSILALVLLLISTDVRQLVDRLIAVRVPTSAAFSVYLLLRFVEILRSDATYVRDALLMRAGGRKWSLTYIRLLLRRYVPTLVLLGMLRADQAAMAMDLRGFSSKGSKTFLSYQRWSIFGWLLPVCYCAGILAMSFAI